MPCDADRCRSAMSEIERCPTCGGMPFGRTRHGAVQARSRPGSGGIVAAADPCAWPARRGDGIDHRRPLRHDRHVADARAASATQSRKLVQSVDRCTDQPAQHVAAGVSSETRRAALLAGRGKKYERHPRLWQVPTQRTRVVAYLVARRSIFALAWRHRRLHGARAVLDPPQGIVRAIGTMTVAGAMRRRAASTGHSRLDAEACSPARWRRAPRAFSSSSVALLTGWLDRDEGVAGHA